MSKPASYPEKINCILYHFEVLCHICKERIMPGEFAADHHPVGRWEGAGNSPEEMKPAHADCNHRKGVVREGRTARHTKRLERAREAQEAGIKKTSKHNWPSKPIPKRADPWGREFAKARKEGRL